MSLAGVARWQGVRAAGVVVLAIVLAAPSVATPAPIPPALSNSSVRDADLAAIARVLEARLVAAHLGTLGLTPEAIQTRLARLDDVELHRLARSLPEAALGGEQRELTGEQKAGVVLLLLIALAAVAGLVYLTFASSPF